MSGTYVPKELIRKVTEQARHRCGFCLTSELLIASQMDVEHIIPEALGGLTVESNLWLCCSKCNSHKSSRINAVDPETGETVPIFNPRTQVWAEHFEWSKEGDLMIGKTPIGRATIVAVQLNRRRLVLSRRLWITLGIHPPKD